MSEKHESLSDYKANEGEFAKYRCSECGAGFSAPRMLCEDGAITYVCPKCNSDNYSEFRNFCYCCDEPIYEADEYCETKDGGIYCRNHFHYHEGE